MTLREAIESYREPLTRGVTGRQQPPDHSCDNSILFSSLYMMLLPYGEAMDEWKWYRRFLESCEKEFGLYYRYPNDVGGEEQHDDYRGVMAACYVLSVKSIPADILLWGRLHLYCWNTAQPEKWSRIYFFGRFPGFVAQLKVASGERLNVFDKLFFLLSCFGILLEPPTETSAVILQWMGCRVMDGQGFICRMGIKFWRKRALRKYAGGLSQVLGMYFTPAHPLALYAPKDFS